MLTSDRQTKASYSMASLMNACFRRDVFNHCFWQTFPKRIVIAVSELPLLTFRISVGKWALLDSYLLLFFSNGSSVRFSTAAAAAAKRNHDVLSQQHPAF